MSALPPKADIRTTQIPVLPLNVTVASGLATQKRFGNLLRGKVTT